MNWQKKISLNPEIFAAEIERYNEPCARGCDMDFFNDPIFIQPVIKPPFYAFFSECFSESAFGGIMINENTEAC